MTHEFWVASGHLLLDRDSEGYLRVTDSFLQAYLARPELLPPAEACAAERDLHARLFSDPRGVIDPAPLADADARENWGFFKVLRDVLVTTPTVEAAYLALLREPRVPPVMLNQLVHVILRNALDGVHDPMMVRAAELFFRPQRVSTHAGRVLLADAEVIEGHEAQRSPLISMLQGAAVELEIISEENAASYWDRSDGHDLVMDLADLRPALGRAIQAWLWHLLRIEAEIDWLARIDDAAWWWFIGLDEEGTRIGNALWDGVASEGDNLLGLWRLLLPEAEGPIYLLLAAGGDGVVRMKPQNLIAALPMTPQT
jgi:hypothetical protein